MFWGILIFVIGLAIGSFTNVLLYRLPRQENFTNSRSRCPNCSSQLKWFDLIPVLSFVLLKGKCRNCHEKISINYPLVELMAGILVYVTWLFFYQDPVLMVFWSIIILFLYILFLFDLRYYILPDMILLAMTIFVVFYKFIASYYDLTLLLVSWRESLISAFVISLILGAIWFFSRGHWLGFGDVKYGFVIGLVFGAYGGLAIFYGAVIIGGVLSLALLIARRANLKTKLPLGTFISIAAILYIFYQVPINNFLQSLLL